MQALLTKWQHHPELRHVDDPTPGPGQVLVKVGGAGACHSDLHLLEDFDGSVMSFSPPFTLGHENAGWVEALGAGVTGLEVGQPVAVYGPWGCGTCRACRLGMENYCEHQAEIGVMGGGLGADGGMAPLLLVPSARLLVPLGDLDPVAAAPLTDAGLTPYHAIKRSLSLLVPGSTAVVIGAGGLGHLGIQILGELSPARIVVVEQRDEAMALAREVGADHVVRAGADAAAEVRELTRGRGAELVVDFVGVDATIALGVAVGRSLGHLTVVGAAGGSYAYGMFSAPYELALSTTYWGSQPELIEVLALAEAGRLTPHVERFSLADAPKAYEALRAGTLKGRAVITPNA